MDIKSARTNLGMSQVEVAKAVGVSVVSFQNWERGVTTPKPEHQEKLIQILKIK